METQIKLYNPTRPQIRAKEAQSLNLLITLLNFGRQTGKSYFMLMDSIERALSSPRQKIYFVVPVISLADAHMGTISAIFDKNPEIKDAVFKRIKIKDNKLEFHNGSFVKFESAEAGDNLRGRTADYIYIDEVAFMHQWVFVEVLLPMVTRTGGRIFMATTPNGRNWFYDYAQRAIEEEALLMEERTMVYVHAVYTELQDPEVDKVIDEFRKVMTDMQFKREVMAQFVTDDTLFTNVEDRVGKPTEKDLKLPRYIGCDLGISNDFTVMFVMANNGMVLDYDRFNMHEDHLTAEEFKQRIKNFYLKWDKDGLLFAAFMEINNNELLFEEIITDKDQYKWLEHLTTGTNKPQMINSLIKAFEDNFITVPDWNKMIAELYSYKAKTNANTGRVQYSNTTEEHDDIVMALAILMYCFREETEGGVTQFL